jgi:osmotically-inducible protein OsmY
MKTVSINKGQFFKVLALILCVGALPILMGVTGCATAESGHQQTTGERIDDHNTSIRVSAALAQDIEYKFDRVKVETFNGTVQLSGFVSSDDQKNRAGDIAGKVEGVKEVRNNITVQVSGN